MHLDLAADSANENPNPQIRDLKIKFKYGDGPKQGQSSGWTKAYGPKLAKILARFQPISRLSKQTGYFVQRNDDNLVGFALANYVQQQIKSYPFLPVIYDKINDAPMLPVKRQSTDPFVIFTADRDQPVSFVNFTTADNGGARQLKDDGACPTVLKNDQGEDLEIGAPIPPDQYPKSYWDERNKWLETIKGDGASGTCKLAITEIWTCDPAGSNLYARASITGADGKAIYTTPQSTQSPGQPINDGNPLSLQENGMKNPLKITGEHTKDYIQFTYGSTSWTSGTKDGNAHCTLKGSDWSKNGPSGCPNAAAIVSVLYLLQRRTSYANEFDYNRHESSIASTLAKLSPPFSFGPLIYKTHFVLFLFTVAVFYLSLFARLSRVPLFAPWLIAAYPPGCGKILVVLDYDLHACFFTAIDLLMPKCKGFSWIFRRLDIVQTGFCMQTFATIITC